MHQRVKLVIRFGVSHCAFAARGSIQWVYSPRWILCALTSFMALGVNADD
jgi:hypothetical protein